MKLYFVRHGETISNKNNTTTGWVDSPLNNEGIEQAKETSIEIPLDFSEIYCSDLIRCKQTAEIINLKLNLPIHYDARLRERNFGSLGGKSWDDISLEMKEIDRNQKYDYRPYGGESAEDVKKRLFAFIEDIRNQKNNKKILIVTHGGIIRMLHNLLNNEVRREIQNSSIHEFDFKD
ncbi:MAG: histidine phosphatase family protein [Candidatus Paceibacterota bacterium]